MIVRILNRRDNATNWTTINPVLGEGELGLETLPNGTFKAKFGNGITKWNDLIYFTGDLTEVNNNINEHINNDSTAHGIDTIKSDLTTTNNNLATTNNNVQLHISNKTTAHGINDILLEIESINQKLEAVDIVSIKGSVDTFSELPNPTRIIEGSAYIVEQDENRNDVTTIYAVVNNEWEFIGEFKVDLSNYYTKGEIDNFVNNKADKSDTYTISDVDNFLNDKSDKINTYTKTEVDTLITNNIVNPGLVNSPHLWAVGTEYDFGDGSFGMRFDHYCGGIC